MTHSHDNSQGDDLRRKMRNYAISLLARREHTCKEIKAKLLSKYKFTDGFSSASVDELLVQLQQDSYLSDERFAEAWVRARMRKGFGPERLRMELAEKGVAEHLAEQMLDSCEGEWLHVIELVWRKKYQSIPADYSEKAKQMNFLRYRGFSHPHIEALFKVLDR